MPNPLGVMLRNRRAGHDTLAWNRPETQAPENFQLTSPAFAHGEPIPAPFRGRLFGANLSPALAWTTPPAETAELLLVVQDPDAPGRTAATHALAAGIDPALLELPEGGLAHPSAVPGVRHGRGPLGRRGWGGPMPIPSHGPHNYVFQLYALSAPLALAEGFTLADALSAAEGTVVGRARLDGTYEIR